MDEELYYKLLDEEHDFEEPEEAYEPTAREEALADIERETIKRVRENWQV